MTVVVQRYALIVVEVRLGPGREVQAHNCKGKDEVEPEAQQAAENMNPLRDGKEPPKAQDSHSWCPRVASQNVLKAGRKQDLTQVVAPVAARVAHMTEVATVIGDMVHCCSSRSLVLQHKDTAGTDYVIAAVRVLWGKGWGNVTAGNLVGMGCVVVVGGLAGKE